MFRKKSLGVIGISLFVPMLAFSQKAPEKKVMPGKSDSKKTSPAIQQVVSLSSMQIKSKVTTEITEQTNSELTGNSSGQSLNYLFEARPWIGIRGHLGVRQIKTEGTLPTPSCGGQTLCRIEISYQDAGFSVGLLSPIKNRIWVAGLLGLSVLNAVSKSSNLIEESSIGTNQVLAARGLVGLRIVSGLTLIYGVHQSTWMNSQSIKIQQSENELSLGYAF